MSSVSFTTTKKAKSILRTESRVISELLGKIRSWQPYMVAHALWYKQTYSYFGILESLSGAAVDVQFLSFDEIRENGVPSDIDVIINAGDAGTAFSGGEEWLDEAATTIRQWVYNGGGFVGVGDPTAVHHGGRFFQLADILGVDKELGFTLSTDKYFKTALDSHFITEDRNSDFNFGESKHDIYALSAATEIIEYSNNEVHMAANAYGKCAASTSPVCHIATRIQDFSCAQCSMQQAKKTVTTSGTLTT